MTAFNWLLQVATYRASGSAAIIVAAQGAIHFQPQLRVVCVEQLVSMAPHFFNLCSLTEKRPKRRTRFLSPH
jgi:hypothetical protein